ncbi:MAG TPA: glucosyl-3-phosphoglycerate synthase [Acidimicrobiales bacterium]|nr:glucosyl-3-phosphoglycerate synthase [Acidimicrobiales bacterium]
MAAVSNVTMPIASYHHGDFPVAELCAIKKDQRISVCIPARDEEATVGPIVEAVHRMLLDGAKLVDELLVVDDWSNDGTAAVAFAAGARIVPVSTVIGWSGGNDLANPAPPFPAAGKGEAMRRGLAASTGDIVVFLDADIENFQVHFVTGLLGPILDRPDTMLVKGCYRRPLGDSPTGGGRVTELVARPVLSLLFPELSGVVQPLAGEVAVRREALEGIELADGYGVELGMLIDISRRFGVRSIAQVDLEVRTHRNRPLHELAPQACDVLDVALRRAGVGVG